MAEKKRSQSPKKVNQGRKSETPILNGNGNQRRRSRFYSRRSSRAPKRSGCYNPEVRKGLGAVIFILGIPTIIAGIVMTAVDANDNDTGSKYPGSFGIVGPILIALGIIFMISGFILSTPVVSKALMQCFDLDDPRGFCRVHCPRFSHCLKPDDIVIMNRHAMNALKSEPGKSSLKKLYNGDAAQKRTLQLIESDPVTGEPREPPPLPDDSADVVSELKSGNSRHKGVRFSESDVYGFREARTSSVNSTSETGSVLSLKNCKVHPKSGIWWTDTASTGHHGDEVFLAKGSRSAEQPTTEL